MSVRKIVIRLLMFALPIYGSAFASTDGGQAPSVGAYTHIYIAALDLNIWSSEKVASVNGLTLEPLAFLKARAEAGLIIRFEGAYVVKFENGKLFYKDGLVEVADNERNIYVSPKGYELGVFIRVFDK